MNRLTVLSILYVTALLISELMATKLIHVFWYVGPAGVIMYPFSFMLADVLTELYGGKTTRKVVWMGLVALFIFVVWTSLGVVMPSLSGDPAAQAYNQVMGFVPRIVAGSLVAYLVGETLNVSVMASLRSKRWFGARTVLSTAVGQALDSSIFLVIAFYGVVPGGTLVRMIITQYAAKVVIEAVLGTPMAYALVKFVRKSETSVPSQAAS